MRIEVFTGRDSTPPLASNLIPVELVDVPLAALIDKELLPTAIFAPTGYPPMFEANS